MPNCLCGTVIGSFKDIMTNKCIFFFFFIRHPVVFEVQWWTKIMYVLSLPQQYIYYMNISFLALSHFETGLEAKVK